MPPTAVIVRDTGCGCHALRSGEIYILEFYRTEFHYIVFTGVRGAIRLMLVTSGLILNSLMMITKGPALKGLYPGFDRPHPARDHQDVPDHSECETRNLDYFILHSGQLSYDMDRAF